MSSLPQTPTQVEPSRARQTVARSRVRPWPTLHTLLTEGSPSLLDDLAAFANAATPEALEAQARRLLYRLGHIAVQGLNDLAADNGAPWAEALVALTAERVRGPEAWNLSAAFGWEPRPNQTVPSFETASYPIVILRHVAGSSADQLRIEGGVVLRAHDPPVRSTQTQEFTVDPPRAHLLRGSIAASPASLSACQPWLRALLGKNLFKGIATGTVPSSLLLDPSAINRALELGQVGQFMLKHLVDFLALDTSSADFDQKASIIFEEVVSRLAADLPRCIEGSYEVVIHKPGPTRVSGGWLLSPSVSVNIPNLGLLRGEPKVFLGDSSVRTLHAMATRWLRPAEGATPVQVPASHVPLAPAYTMGNHPELPDAAELAAFGLTELVRAAEDTTAAGQVPFASLDTRMRAGRLAMHLAATVVPAGVPEVWFKKPETARPVVALDGELVQEVSPHLTLSLSVPHSTEYSATTTLSARVAASWTDVAEAHTRALELRDALK